VSAGWRVTAVAALAAALVAGAAAWRLARAPRPEPRPVRRFAIALPENAPLVIRTFGQQMALSPDGSRLVYVGPNGGSTQLYLRRLDRLEVDAIPGTEGATGPFFSPDGEWVGFFAEQKLKKISVRGGAAVTLAEASISLRASWGPDGMIVYTPGVASGLWQVSASGGAPQALTALDSAKGETSHLAPWILPDGKSVLFCNEMAGKGTSSVAIQSLETGERRTLIEGGCQAWYVPSGHLLYFLKDSFRAVPFDPLRLEPNGTDTTVLEGIGMGGAPQFSVSADGTLVYASGTGYLAQQSLVWTGRRGAATPLGPPPGRYLEPRLSPDARRVALRIISADDDIWIYELARGTQTRLTFEGENWDPVWSPDGKRIAFCSSRQGPANLYSVPADGSGALERLTTSEREQFPTSFSPDGKILAYTEIDPKTGMDIWMLPLGGKREPRPFLRTAFSEHAPAFSPDGRWIAYVSNESRRDEVYVQPHPASGRKWQVSVEGGREPVWARSGRDLFFRSGDRMMAVAVQTHPEFTAGQPVALFAGRYARSDPFSVPGYDVALDGQRFLMVKESEQGTVHTHVNVVLNWFEELRQRVPPGGR
jgi:serine/threonine-protein kinase